MSKISTYTVLRGTEVVLRDLMDYHNALALAEELAYFTPFDVLVVKVLAVIDGKGGK